MTPAMDTISRDAVFQSRFYRTRQEAGIAHFELERMEPPLKNYDKEIGGFLAGFIPFAWYMLMVALGIAR